MFLNSRYFFSSILCYISVPGEPYPLKNYTTPAPVPAPSADNFAGIASL